MFNIFHSAPLIHLYNVVFRYKVKITACFSNILQVRLEYRGYSSLVT